MAKKRKDVNENAARVVRLATREETLPAAAGKDPLAVELGRRGGRKGGLARARKLTPRRRNAIARKAARTRWGSRPA